jgi:hypothetical protein
MAGFICGALALPARAQDCYYPATGDSYLYADGQGDVYGYSVTYNTCQDPGIAAMVSAALTDAGGYYLDSGSDAEYYNGADAVVNTAATVFYAGNYYQYGLHQYYDAYCEEYAAANPMYTEYMAYSPAPNEVPTVTSVWPDDSGGDPSWTPGGGPYEVAFSGEDLTGEIPSVTDTGCSSAYAVSAWQTADSAVWTNVTVLAYPASACYVSFSLLGALAQVLLAPAPPPTITASIHNGSTTGPDITGSTQNVTVGVFSSIFAVPSCCLPTYQWSLPGHTLSAAWSPNVQSTAGEPAAVTALNGSNLFWAPWDASGSGRQVQATVTAPGSSATPSVTYTITPPQLTTLSANESGVHIGTDCPGSSGTLEMCLYSGGGPPGIAFNLPAILPSDGSYELVQVVESATADYTDTSGAVHPYSTSGLDAAPAGSTDFPAVALSSGYTEVGVQESFSTYLMFQVVSSSSWVPVAVVNWSWAGDAVLANGTWTLKSSSPNPEPGGTAAVAGASAAAFPSWTQYVGSLGP